MLPTQPWVLPDASRLICDVERLDIFISKVSNNLTKIRMKVVAPDQAMQQIQANS
jgi:hypothetical protein